MTARLDLFTAVPPKIISVEEDRRRGPSEMLNELHTLQEQLTSTYKALGCALGQLSAANAHCMSRSSPHKMYFIVKGFTPLSLT